MPIVTPTQVFDFLGITPTTPQINAMTIITTGVESSIKKFCRWQITEESRTSYLPLLPTAHGPVVLTAEFVRNRPWPTGTRNRLQIPALHIKSIASIHEDYDAIAGAHVDDFDSTTLLLADRDYFLEKSEGSEISESGGVIREGINWSSEPGTIKVVFTSGYSEAELAGTNNCLRFEAMNECLERWLRRQRIISRYVTGLGEGHDTSGDLIREKLGDHEIGFAGPRGRASETTEVEQGLSERMKTFLQDSGYVYCAIGV